MGETEKQYPLNRELFFHEVLKTTVYLKHVGKVYSNFCCTEYKGAGVGHDQELDDSVVGLIFLWLCHSQEPDKEAVPLVHSVAWRLQDE